MTSKYTISTNLEAMDVELIHVVIADSYWAKGIPLETLRKSLSNSLCFGVFTSSGSQVGFARMITDKATFAYLADVFVAPEHQGRGLAKQLMASIINHPDLQGLRSMLLATRDAHGLYEQFGFNALASPDTFMELCKPDVYSAA